MNTKNLLLLVCILGFSSLAFAGIDVSIEQVDSDGNIVSGSSRLLPGSENDYICTLILYTEENIKNNGGLQVVLNVYGPPYGGGANLDDLYDSSAYFHNLKRIVYQGPHCDCTFTIFQGLSGSGKSKEYYSVTAVDSSAQTKVDLDWCWSNKAESMLVECTV